MLPKKIVLLLALVAFSCKVSAQQLTPAQIKSITQATQGGIINLEGFINQKFSTISYQKLILPGPQYLISDDPEYIRVPDAIALKEQVTPGSVRLYLYNVNAVISPNKIDRKITALIKNTGKSVMHLRMLKYA